jgi:CBS domain-containing protein
MSNTLAKNLRGDRVERLRLRRVYAVTPATPVSEAVRGMSEQRATCALVTDAAGKLVGIFTERDFLARVVAAGVKPEATAVERVMSPAPRTVAPHDSVYDAVEAMASGNFRHLPVVRTDGTAVGVLSVKDVMRYLVEYFPAKVYNLPPTPDQNQPAREGA